VVALSIFWPLEKVRLEMQTQTQQQKVQQPPRESTPRLTEADQKEEEKENNKVEEVTVWKCIRNIWRTRGFQGFYQGYQSAFVGTSSDTASTIFLR
jgi:hypothetical protein